jgi:EmrB/QacA subfamily drug resistance transporter
MTRPPRPEVAAQPITREQLLLLVALMAGLAVAALDTTIVATAMPTIVGELEGMQSYGWVFSSYLLAATVTVPLFSKVADMRGRKKVFLVGIALFVTGSALCGLAQSIEQLVAFRGLQGLGAGAIQPMVLTIVGDSFDPIQRARLQGFMSSVWGVAAVLGPALGGILTDLVGWRWVFLINLPVGALAAWLMVLHFHERVEVRRHRIDWLGTFSLSAGVALVLLAVNEFGPAVGWSSPAFVAALAVAATLLVWFVRVEHRADEPIIDFEIIRRPLIAIGLTLQALTGLLLFGLQSYIPPMVQGVHGRSATAAGAAVAVMSLSWASVSPLAGRWLARSSARYPIVVGTGCFVVGTVLVTQIERTMSLQYVMASAAIVGFGMGLVNTVLIVVLQSSVPWGERGVVTGAVQFSRTIGGAIGVGLLGAVLTHSAGSGSGRILDPLERDNVPGSTLDGLRASVATGLTHIYVVLVVVAVGSFVVALMRMPATTIAARPQPGPTPATIGDA